MSSKKFLSKISFSIVRFIMFLVEIFPENVSIKIADLIAYFTYKINWKRKDIALNNLKIAFGDEKTENEINLIFKNSLRKIARNLFTMIFILKRKLTENDILNLFEVEGIEYLDEALKKGKGVIALSGHIGNFPLMIIWLALRKYEVSVIYKEAKNFPKDFYRNLMLPYGIDPIQYTSQFSVVASILKALNKNKIVLIQIDQNKPRGVYVEFFGKYIPTAEGPVVIARKTKSPIIPIFALNINNKYKIKIFPEVELNYDLPDEIFIQESTQSLTKIIENVIREYPDEWFWLHNRWKMAQNKEQVSNLSENKSENLRQAY
ncbi:MAG: lysophospholipid acyltransferase family protein [Ignavibacterium sp.]